MGKRRLTRRQQAQLKSNQAKRLARSHERLPEDTLNQSLGPEQPGLLIAHYGNTLIVENQAGQLYRCGLRQNLGHLVTGDRVIWQNIDDKTGIVVACQERRSLITRPDGHSFKPIVANVDQLVIIVAIEPFPQKTTLDRYLVIAENFQLPAMIILNKCDLSLPAENELKQKCIVYQQLGYPFFEVSAKTGKGLSDLAARLQSLASVFVGQSGVGKSSLLQALIPTANVRIRELSTLQRLGRHTTTASSLYHLDQGGDIIDSPGIHRFSVRHLTKEAILKGFKELVPFIGLCQFRNCQHLKEPGCALQEAVNLGKIAPFRLESYHKLISDIIT